ncbi:amidase [Nocardia farcinica]|uniref:amidase n=1 Tax=Nocardia farcinica TaxID=37329 RepID=UPI0018931FDA|nr:amidase [Nocardia farcinica]MBF6387785.1 amidase [Nocardia farcinica]
MPPIHAFVDDALADHDAVELARQVAARTVSPAELATAALDRARRVNDTLRAVAATYPEPRFAPEGRGALSGIPTYIKDNVDVAGLPTQHGSVAFTAPAARRDGQVTRQFLATGVTVLGKSRLPEFGLTPTTEFATQEPARNPWHLNHSPGGSSGGAAALVASGVVPLAHGNDGGGSIRIPAACAGLVGLKTNRGRLLDSEQTRLMPLNLVSEGVLTRTVRDSAAFLAAAERYHRNPALPPIGEVMGPAMRRLRIGLVTESPTGAVVDEPTMAAVEATARILEKAGHIVEPTSPPVTTRFVHDFTLYWAFLADVLTTTGRFGFGASWNTADAEHATRGLRAYHRRTLHQTPAALRRLRRFRHVYDTWLARHDVILSPVVAHTAPELGYFAGTSSFDELLARMANFVSFTPVNNVAGSPAIAIPAGLSPDGLPVAIHLSAAYGDERTLLELAYLLEAEQPFPRIDGRAPAV